MGLSLTLCRLSANRLQLLRDDPALLWEVLSAEERVPGLLRVGKAWDALQQVVKPWDPQGHMGRLLTASGGQELESGGPFGDPHIFDVEIVHELDAVCSSMPDDPTSRRWPELMGLAVHGDFFAAEEDGGPTGDPELDELLDQLDTPSPDVAAELDAAWRSIRALVYEAHSEGHHLLSIIT